VLPYEEISAYDPRTGTPDTVKKELDYGVVDKYRKIWEK
jgi:hypothetical protein